MSAKSFPSCFLQIFTFAMYKKEKKNTNYNLVWVHIFLLFLFEYRFFSALILGFFAFIVFLCSTDPIGMQSLGGCAWQGGGWEGEGQDGQQGGGRGVGQECGLWETSPHPHLSSPSRDSSSWLLSSARLIYRYAQCLRGGEIETEIPFFSLFRPEIFGTKLKITQRWRLGIL